MIKQLTAVIQREGDGFVRSAPSWTSPVKATALRKRASNLREALELFFEFASPEEIERRTGGEVFVTHVEVAIG